MKRLVITIILFLFCQYVFPQGNARNGCSHPSNGTLRLFIVFADVVDDTIYTNEEIPGWPSGSIPDYADAIVDTAVATSYQTLVSKYYHEASFGQLEIVGDYYPYLLQFTFADMANCNKQFTARVIERLNSLPGSDITTAHGYHLSDFDGWTTPPGYSPKYNTPDSKIDLLVIVWRRNSHYKTIREGGQCFGANNNSLKYMNGANRCMFIYYDDVCKVIQHEYAHLLLGDNSYHTGGAGNGVGYFLSNIGGYGLLSSYNRNLYSPNGWDRWRLGWKHSSKNHYISALDMDGEEIETDFEYGEELAVCDFILRDFCTYGDAIRIKLPYLKSIKTNTRNQYLWIENHQITENSVEYDTKQPAGIRFNIEIGNDNLTGDFYSSQTNHFVPLSAFGNYDFTYTPDSCPPEGASPKDYYDAYTTYNMQNPLTGYHPSMLHAINFIPENSLDDTIKTKELVMLWKIYRDGVLVLKEHPIFGNRYDAFSVGRSLRMSSNPSSAPLINYSSGHRNDSITHPPKAKAYDNRHVFLNGLRVDIVQRYRDGRIRVRIRWNDYDIDRDTRWCGPIVLTDSLIVKKNVNLLVDYGQTPTRPYNPRYRNGVQYFSDPSVFTCRENSCFMQEESSEVNFIAGSTLILENNATYFIGNNATLNISDSSSLVLKAGSVLHIRGRGQLNINNGASFCVESGASIILDDTLSALNLHSGYVIGNNDPTCNCLSDVADIHLWGNGAIHANYNDTVYLQNTTITNTRYITGRNVEAGYDVAPIPVGAVNLEQGADVIIDSENGTLLKNEVNIESGAALEIRSGE